MDKEKFITLCTKEISGEISPVEKQKLEKWLKASPENNQTFHELEKTWNTLAPRPLENLPDIDTEWSILENRLGFGKPEIKKTNIFRALFSNSLLTPGYRPALLSFATLFLLAVCVFILKPDLSPNRLFEVETQNKEKRQLILSDGTQVTLNGRSILQYQKKFKKEQRSVFLNGEAFFNVTKQEIPFVVKTENAQTTVLGTEFDIRSRDNETRVIVKSGRVKLSSMHDTRGDVILEKDQMSLVTGKVLPAPPKDVNAEHLLGWIEGRLVFERSPLNDILTELEITYDVSIYLENDSFETRTLTATFDNLTIETILSSICTTLNANYYYDEDAYYLRFN